MPWGKEEILFEWVCPKELVDVWVKGNLRLVKASLPRIFFVTAIVWWGLYFVLDYLFPKDLGINLEKMFLVGFGAVMLLLAVICLRVLLDSRHRIKYRVTSNRVYIGNERIIRWKDMVGYKLFEYQDLKGFTGVQLFFHKYRHFRSICLPQSEQAAEIIKYIAQRVPLYENLPSSYEVIKLTTSQKFFLYVFTFAYSVVISWCIVLYEAFWLGKFFPALFFLGPGTIYFPAIFGKRFFKNRCLMSFAFLCNIIALFLTMLFTIFLWLYHFKQTIPGW